jgi:hypothetical protein
MENRLACIPNLGDSWQYIRYDIEHDMPSHTPSSFLLCIMSRWKLLTESVTVTLVRLG